MKNITLEMLSHLANDVTNLTTCWKLSLMNGNVLGFTSHDRDILFDNQNYIAESGFIPSEVSSNSDLEADNLRLEGIISNNLIKEEDINAGLYDFAEVEIFILNYKDVSKGKITIKQGSIGDIETKGLNFQCQIKGKINNLSKNIGNVYSPSCRAQLGDNKCSVNISSYTNSSSVDSVTDNRILSASGISQNDGFFNYGKITFTSGSNNGLSMEIKEFRNNKITLALPMPYNIKKNDNFTIHAGCDKHIGTCISRFNNAKNFRGEPHVPGTDYMLQTSSTT